MKTKLAAIMTAAAITAGCMGTVPKPIAPYQYGDDKKTCQMLQAEVSDCEAQINALDKRRQGKVGGNIVIGAVGAVLFWPALFFMDSKSDEQSEIDALQKRRQSLANIAIDQGCEWCVGKDFSSYNPPKSNSNGHDTGLSESLTTSGNR